jgi:hypothetical protein
MWGLIFKPEISVGDIIAALGFVIAALALFLTLWQLRRDSVRKRAEFIVSIFNQYVTDSETADLFYKMEYDQFHYGPEFHESKQEQQLDRLLSYFEKIAALYLMRVITRDDLELIRYEFIRVYKNPAVQSYFKFLDTLPDEVGVSGGTFKRFRLVAATLGGEKGSQCYVATKKSGQ